MSAEATTLDRMTARLCALALAEAAITGKSIEQLQAGIFQQKNGNAARGAELRAVSVAAGLAANSINAISSTA